ncbi:DELLA protein [Melia azedarach]|uniref:DELLA protein n=1 Tax=Melia azedarach TaxID=155640 RepID=A0ACC1YF75_MELAZ|nr:DELLA protein [Melia azedarach]
MASVRRLSTEDVMRIARTRFIKLSSQGHADISIFNHSFEGNRFGLCGEDIKDVELALLLVASAEEISKEQYASAGKFLNLCSFLSSNRGNSVQRVAHCFTKALQERIDRESGRVETKRSERIQGQILPEEKIMSLTPAVITSSLQISFIQVSQLAGIQTIMENVAMAKKIHLIDFSIRSGGQCIALMQALAARNECSLELLKITAVGTLSKQTIVEAGERLASFAEALAIPFAFKIAGLTDIKDINKDIFEINEDEVVVVSSRLMLRHLIFKTDGLESVLRVVRNLNPRVMVIIELEASQSQFTYFHRPFL